MSIAIRVENLSKAYQIGQIGTGTVSRDIERWFVTKVMRREDPFLKIGEVNDRSKKGESDIVWSLKDINFDINQGDAVGIIGKNGAGKSTLLKLLSRVTSPTTGSVKLKGRVASLLEVGTGFHPELTGRENIYLNGAILGMRKREIDRKFDEIVDFSGVERYIDTPVKRYSSGMYVRLAFAVAAHLESEILIVDEVLAVGDAEFQKKCLGKMKDVSEGEGRTVLFVSHNLSAVQDLCSFGLLIENGQLRYSGPVSNCLSTYLTSNTSLPVGGNSNACSFSIRDIRINGQIQEVLPVNQGFEVSAKVSANNVSDAVFILIIENASGQQVVHAKVTGKDIGLSSENGETKLVAKIPNLWLSSGAYSAYIKALPNSPAFPRRVDSERILFSIKGNFDPTGKTILTPIVEWEASFINRSIATAATSPRFKGRATL